MSDLPETIRARITVHPTSNCWLVGGYHDRDGYARIRGQSAHRVIWQILEGPIPPGLVLDHREDQGCTLNGGMPDKACAFPGHLRPVTHRENCTRNGLTGLAAVNATKVKCDNGHPFDLFTTYIRPNGNRDCRICICERVKKYKRRLREAAKATGFAAPLELGRAA
jgi:hypothetical protein